MGCPKLPDEVVWDGNELLAVEYRFDPGEIEALFVDDWLEWVKRAVARVKARVKAMGQ